MSPQIKTFRASLLNFLEAVSANRVPYLPDETDTSLFYLRLDTSGGWEVTRTLTDNLSQKDICLPLVVPVVPIILFAHLEIQLARIEAIVSAHGEKTLLSMS